MQVVGKYRLKFKGMVQSRNTYILIKLWVKSKNMKLNEAANEMRQRREVQCLSSGTPKDDYGAIIRINFRKGRTP